MNNKQTMTLYADYYRKYDRLGEGVYYEYIVEYDLKSILENNFNKSNFNILLVGIPKDFDGYFSQYGINKSEWEASMVEDLLDPDNDFVQEDFFENVPEDFVEKYHEKYYPSY